MKKKLTDGNHGQGTHSTKMGAGSFAENTPSTSEFFWPICPMGPQVWDIVVKRHHRVSVVCDLGLRRPAGSFTKCLWSKIPLIDNCASKACQK